MLLLLFSGTRLNKLGHKKAAMPAANLCDCQVGQCTDFRSCDLCPGLCTECALLS